ncbi:MAG: phosphoribosyltransferase, partial [Thermovibrio sp.]
MVFSDRREAGELLAREIYERFGRTLVDPVVVAIPRGGVVVAEPIADVLRAPIELVFPRKIGAPFNEEFAVGAVTEDGRILLNPYAEVIGVTEEYLKRKA